MNGSVLGFDGLERVVAVPDERVCGGDKWLTGEIWKSCWAWSYVSGALAALAGCCDVVGLL